MMRNTEERQRLADAVKQHRVNHAAVPDQPDGTLFSSGFILLPAQGYPVMSVYWEPGG